MSNRNVISSNEENVYNIHPVSKEAVIAACQMTRDQSGFESTVGKWPWVTMASPDEPTKSSFATSGNPRPGHRYKLFARGFTTSAFIRRVMDPHGLGSWTDSETDLMRKVGAQGYMFSPYYVFKTTVAAYYDAAASWAGKLNHGLLKAKSRIPESQTTVLGARFRRLCGLGDNDYIEILTDHDAINVVCSKNTVAFPLMVDKNEPESREYCMQHLGERGGKVLMGQRYQRNKQNAAGEPIPRGIFNAHILDVVQDARFVTPLTNALQKFALSNLSPFCELNGPTQVGRSLYQWYWEGKQLRLTAASLDVKSMDTQMDPDAFETVYQIIKWAFRESDRSLLRESLMHIFSDVLVINECDELHGWHNMFSGGTVWTHIAESIYMWAGCVSATALLRYRIAGDKSLKEHPVSNWKQPLILNGGDDCVICFGVPESKADKPWTDRVFALDGDDPCAYYVRWFKRYLNLELSPEKCDFSVGYVEYESKRFSTNETGTSPDGMWKYFRPVYFMTYCLNNILNPESTTSTSITDELARVAMIADQSYKHPSWNNLITQLWDSCSEADQGVIVDILVNKIADVQESARYVRRSYTYLTEAWNCESSPTLQKILALAGLESDTLDSVLNAKRIQAMAKQALWLTGFGSGWMDMQKVISTIAWCAIKKFEPCLTIVDEEDQPILIDGEKFTETFGYEFTVDNLAHVGLSYGCGKAAEMNSFFLKDAIKFCHSLEKLCGILDIDLSGTNDAALIEAEDFILNRSDDDSIMEWLSNYCIAEGKFPFTTSYELVPMSLGHRDPRDQRKFDNSVAFDKLIQVDDPKAYLETLRGRSADTQSAPIAVDEDSMWDVLNI